MRSDIVARGPKRTLPHEVCVAYCWLPHDVCVAQMSRSLPCNPALQRHFSSLVMQTCLWPYVASHLLHNLRAFKPLLRSKKVLYRWFPQVCVGKSCCFHTTFAWRKRRIMPFESCSPAPFFKVRDPRNRIRGINTTFHIRVHLSLFFLFTIWS